MWMAREMTLSREWKTRELRQVAMALFKDSGQIADLSALMGVDAEGQLTFRVYRESGRSRPQRGKCCRGESRAVQRSAEVSVWSK